jgi:hypothetical protein
MRSLEVQLERHFSEVFRRIWVQRHSREVKRDVVITLFPKSLTANYRIIVARDLHDMSFEELRDIIVAEFFEIVG